jgi:hypothetical protein
MRPKTTDVEDLRARIERWRGARGKRAHLSAELWSAAVEIADRDGIAPTARALDVGYGTLRWRMATTRRDRVAKESGATGFVEIGPGPFMAPHRDEIVVEFAAEGAGRVTCRLPADAGLDVPALAGRIAAAFWHRSRRP